MKTVLLFLCVTSLLGCAARVKPLIMISIDANSLSTVPPEKIAAARTALEYDLMFRGYALTQNKKNADVILYTRYVYEERYPSLGRLVELRQKKNPMKEAFAHRDERSFIPSITDDITGANGMVP